VAMRPMRGSLLISSATLEDPNFARTLVLVLDSDEGGSLGVILNRPSERPVGDVLTSWRDLTTPPQVLFSGGPVEGNAAIAVAALAGTERPEAWQELTATEPGQGAGMTLGLTLGLIDLDQPADTYVGKLAALRVYAGYAGWGAGQLEAEIEEGAWHLAPAAQGDLFHPRPDTLWREVLRRQPGQVAMLTTLPEDATLN
jgi:putative transcriptional regulator